MKARRMVVGGLEGPDVTGCRLPLARVPIPCLCGNSVQSGKAYFELLASGLKKTRIVTLSPNPHWKTVSCFVE